MQAQVHTVFKIKTGHAKTILRNSVIRKNSVCETEQSVSESNSSVHVCVCVDWCLLLRGVLSPDTERLEDSV